VPVVPCSNEHVHGNSVVKAFLSESRGTRALVNVRLCSGKFARGTPAATIKPVRVVSSVVEHLVYTEFWAVFAPFCQSDRLPLVNATHTRFS